ncbi:MULTISPECIES: SGNH/GDSL hydrolase family protein [unclassified Methylobacterium]|jgi:lysophospholipase L1-like esterase|uniref:SGNH/GDSL hydrolase family protein n=1 Tax=unclassified Methylobacterium TaxID=2615210 RepID=UPI001353F394|nr:SGNH/GDSL hydrolase family protein [Methylobacterium sp. 2A]MWV22827.1 SGNH/GDSL hydrolase family protein [Methylobacterium sp. 2A]
MTQRTSDADALIRRQTFVRLFQNFDANSRFPAPYVQFAGKPLAFQPDRGWRYDGLGYFNTMHAEARPASETLRVFLVGDSTLLEGQVFADTVPGRLETGLKRTHGEGARVYNFGAISANLNQMIALITTRLMDLQPDVILIVGGGTDIFQPWSFDPRAGYPFNHFASECLHDYFFDTRRSEAETEALSYESLQAMIFNRLENLRALTNWQSDIWEWEVVRHFELSLKRLARLAPGIGAPIRFYLQPTVVRKTERVAEEANAASGSFLAYLDRQYDRFEGVLNRLDLGPDTPFAVRDLSRLFADDRRFLFTDIVHVTSEGRQVMAERLQAEVSALLGARTGAPA